MMRVISLATALSTASCSFAMVDAPPRRPPPGPVSCDIENGAVDADLAAFGLFMLVGLVTTAAAAGRGVEQTQMVAVGVMSGGATLYGVAGYYGTHQLRRCRSLNGMPLE